MSGDAKQDKPVKVVGAVAQAFRILRLLAEENRPLGVNAIARDAKVNPSTAFNILRTLVLEEAVAFDPLSKTYKLGQGLVRLSARLLEQSIVADMRGELNRLATDTNCLIGIWQIVDRRATLIERVTGSRAMRLDMEIKQRLSFMAGALGRAHAAQLRLPDAQIRARFPELRWGGAIDVDTYIAEVRAAERVGYAIDNETLYPGVVTVAAVITNQSGEAVYGLTASDIAHNLDDARIRMLGDEMAGIARAFSLSQ